MKEIPSERPIGERDGGRLLLAAVTCGALWGLAETTLGFALHLLSRLTSLPHLAGFFMFPVGFLFMLQAFRATHRAQAAVLTAAVAAALKLASAALPGVGLEFAANPALAILSEGLIGFALLPRQIRQPRPAVVPVVFAAGLVWRVLFLALLVLLPVQKGILRKGPAALASFLLLDSAVNSLLIAAALRLGAGEARAPRLRRALLRPVSALAAAAAALGAEAALALL